MYKNLLQNFLGGLSKEIDKRDELIHDYRKKITEYEKIYFGELYEIADEWSKNFRKKRG